MKYFDTMSEMAEYYYGSDGHVAKTDAPVLSTTTGVYNAVYGAQVFNQLNTEANGWALLPKIPWQKSGWRVITADAGTTGDGGTTENGAVADSIKPTFKEISTKPAQVQHVYEVSMLHEGLVTKGADDSTGDLAFLRGYFATLHVKRLNEQLFIDGDTLASAGNTIESLDRVTASYAYATAVSWTAGDEDIYGIDRSANSWADAIVSHNSGTDRVLTMEIIRDTLALGAQAGARTNVIITGNDTLYRIFGLAESQVRYAGVVSRDALVQIGINGVQTEQGLGFGLRVATVYGIPAFGVQAVQKDTISRIYLLDTTENEDGTPRLFIAVMWPTLNYESGMAAADKNPFSIDTLGTKGMYYTCAQLICTRLNVQMSIRDLK